MAIVNLKVVVDKADVSADIKELKKELNGLSRTFSSVKGSSIDSLQRQTANLLNNIKGIEKNYPKDAFRKAKTDTRQLLTEITSLNAQIGNKKPTKAQIKQMAELSQRLGKVKSEFATTRAEAENFHGSLRDLISGFAKFTLSATLVMKPIQMLRSAWNSLNEVLAVTESRAVAIARVLKEDISTDKITSDLYHLAQEYGQTFENVQELATNFARSGLDWADTTKAVESALLALNVAELDATQASEGLLAIMTQFGYEAEDLLLIVDKLNITADNANVTTEKLLTALQRTGSSAKNAKMDLEETVGVITALSEATNRSGENLGTAVNSLIQFSTKSSSLETFSKLGGDVKKAVESYKVGAGSVLDIWTALSGVIKSNTSNSEGILSGLFSDDDWRTLNEELQTELGENFATVTEIYDTASTFRKNYFIALLNNMDQVESTMKDMEGANGYSQKENLEYLDTYEAKVNKLNSKWQELANDEQGFLAFKKGLVDIGSGILTVVEWTGGLRTVVIALGGSLIGVLIPAISALKVKMAALGITFNATFGWITAITTGISLLVGVVQQYNQAQAELRQEQIATWEAEKEQIAQLDLLYDKYQKLAKGSDEWLSVEKQLAIFLNDETGVLAGLTEGTDDYREALEKLIQLKLREAQQDQTLAKKAAEEELQGFRFKSIALVGRASQKNKTVTQILENAGIG